MKKIFSQIAIVCMASMTFFACTKVEEMDNRTNPLPIPHNDEVETVLQGLTVSPRTNYVVIGDEFTLTVTANPANAVLGTLTWTSSDEAVASVDATGRVKAKAKGMTLVTAASGEVSVTAIVNVYAERVAATAIALSKTDITLLVGRATQIRAHLLPDGSGEGEQATTDQLNLEWSSSNENVATVNYGFVQAVGLGEAVLTARQGDLSATVKVTVADKVQLRDRSQSWKITDAPKWDKDWNGNISGSHEDVTLEGFDADLAWFQVVAADKFADVETVSNDVYLQVEDLRDQDKDPKSLFKSGEKQTISYSDLGEAVAVVLGYDAECEFTGEYAIYRFEARTPDPVHATGMKFTQGWSGDEITEITLKEGKSMNYFRAVLLPDDCTDTGDISYASTDESVVKITPYYSGYYTVVAIGQGSASIVATFNDITASIPVTVTGDSMVWTDRSAEWAGTFGDVEQWGSMYFGFTLTACTSPKHMLFLAKASDISGDLVAYMKAQASSQEEWLSYYAKSDIPDSEVNWNGSGADEHYAFVVGVDASGASFDGNYAIFHYDPNGGGDEPDPGPGPGPEPQEGKVVSLDGQYFALDWDDMDAVQDEVTMEAWINSSSFSGGKDDIYTVMGTEGIFLLRFEGNKLNLVYGGDKKANGEYNEKKVSYNVAFETGKWYHIAATYSSGGEAVLYVDGEKVGSNSAEDHAIELNGVGAEWVLPFKFYVGVSSNNRVFKGSLAYLRVWDCARSASEIKDNMKVADPADDGYDLLASWHFDEGSGNVIADHGATKDYALTATGDLSWIDGELPF